jgi:hypothetical protein
MEQMGIEQSSEVKKKSKPLPKRKHARPRRPSH